ncbi:regulatory protein for ClpA substrate specificity [Candidatus Desulfarcum epimagneticum]|uniref:ATP-dependent Clp protease adapter protein ClpS n=1 Tax=uncultured Desulfobacteraceae bacterium TaxID=218296 RepID=A0A484HJ52_9BACT|nr:regulatory protein for ClpA substrate specificity [uncultured Desulfobacteraceae bacterium]
MGRREREAGRDPWANVEDEIKEPAMYKVFLHNDHYTAMDFVVDILMSVFGKPFEEASRIMLLVHQEGLGLCGVYPHDIASTKVDRVHYLARKNGFPLKCSMERE